MATLLAAGPPAQASEAAIAEGLEPPSARAELAHGKVLAALSRSERGAVLRLEIAEGWHVMADQPGWRYALPMQVTGPAVTAVAFPTAETLSVSGAVSPLQVFTGAPEIDLALDDAAPAEIVITVQTCSTEICLPPDQARLGL